MTDTGPIIVDSGPIIALASVGLLDLLGAMHGTVLVPDAVMREVAEVGGGRAGALELARASWAQRVVVEPPPETLLAEELDIGEAEVITLAVRRSAALVILDERRARRIAQLAYSLRLRGTAGTLVEAKRRGLVSAVRPALENIKANGYFLSPRLIERACREAGETDPTQK